MLGDLAVLDAEDVKGDHRRFAKALIAGVHGDDVIIRNHANIVRLESAAACEKCNDAFLRLDTVGEHLVVLNDVFGEILVDGLQVARQQRVFERFEDKGLGVGAIGLRREGQGHDECR